MPKASTKATPATKADAPAEAPVIVSAAVKAAVLAVLTASAGVQAALKVQDQSWVKCAQAISEECDTEEEGAALLKEAFATHISTVIAKLPAPDQEAEKTRLTLLYGTYRSKIKSLAFPEDPKQMEAALKDNLDVNKLIDVSRNNLRKSKKTGEWIKVEKSAGHGPGSGGANKKKPIDTLSTSLALSLTAASTAKIDTQQLAVVLSAALKDTTFDLDDLIEELEKLND